jgi:cytochrome c
MKKIIVIIAIASGLFIASCGNQNGTNNPSGGDNSNTTGNGVNDSNQVGNQNGNNPPANDSFANSIPSGGASGQSSTSGSALIASNDCKTCHNIQGKMIGPSYQMIADKYGNNDAMADELSLKIIKGGSGRWGQVVMPAHQNVSTDQAREMARYILSLSTKK